MIGLQQRDAHASCPTYPAQSVRDAVRDELVAETARRAQSVRWGLPDRDHVGDRLVEYQMAKPSSTPDSVLGSMRQHLFYGMGVLGSADAVRLMHALEHAHVVSQMPRQVEDMSGLSAALDRFRTGVVFGKALSNEKKAQVRDHLVTFDHLARHRAHLIAERDQLRQALTQQLEVQAQRLNAYGHPRAWYRQQLLGNSALQRIQDRYVRCTELLYTYPSALPV